ncbi:hypothetical protein OG735_09640 [Streptomyces sp. NBC_01210]|uniref:hypothetical protein n=1 Tax=Streptomyces sp. NBC_01210 TaxID=2903774 RepID=UPI002E0EEBA9|nr:hypothetical protein OG735_09640 [Streptomyces sp. NBC_01210]
MSDSMPGPEIQEQGFQEGPVSPEPENPASENPASENPDRESREPAGPGAAARQAYDPAAPAPVGVQRVPTGNADVDDRLERLADADHLPADGHLEVYEDVHRGLRDALTALDARPAPAPQGPSPSPSYDNRS